MKPAFVSSAPLPTRTPILGAAVCPSSPAPTKRTARAVVRMVAEEKKKEQSLLDWLSGKFMHNALWEGDQEAGYELYFVKAMEAREEEKRKAYEAMDKEE